MSGLSLRPGAGPQPAEGPRGMQACVPECCVTLGVWLPVLGFPGCEAEPGSRGLRPRSLQPA